MKRIIAILAVTALLLTSAACSAETPAVSATQAPTATQAAEIETAAPQTAVSGEETQMLELTLDELKQFDGKNGNPAYVAVDGVIYDVTNLSRWKNGEHNGYSAGNDLTDIIKNKSPHGVKKLEGVPIVGTLVDG